MEKYLDDEILIVTKTDLKAYITYANKDFLNIVNCKEEEILGKNHNIIRNKDMPKAVFKLLWEKLKKEEEVFAFVKNNTFDNSFYWVYANISPSYDANNKLIGYYSVRRKINENAKDIIINIYKKLLEIEQNSGVIKSYEYLFSLLEKNNICYDEFVIKLQKGEIKDVKF